MFIPIPQLVREYKSTSGVLLDLREGFEWLWSKRPIMMVMGISLMINMATNPAFTLLSLLITEHFNGGAIELAWVQSSNGLGMILGGLALGLWGGFQSRERTAFSALLVGGLGLLSFSFTPGNMFGLGVGFVFVFGFMNAIANSSFFSILQTVIPHEIQGRILTLVMASSVAVTPIGLVIAGPVAEVFGIGFWFKISGLGILAGSILGFMIPGLSELTKSVINP
jgi:DHA3 family macrolide efflux protein-like MFS transporter